MQMKKLTTLACAAAFATLSGTASAQVSGNTVKIGVLTDLSGTYSDTPGTNRTFGLDIKADSLAYTTASDDPGMEMKQTSTSETVGIEMSMDFALPSTIALTAIASPADFTTALNEGLSFSLLMNKVRSELLAIYLDDGARALSEVSDLLGFAAPSAFSRWHRARFGVAARSRMSARAPKWLR